MDTEYLQGAKTDKKEHRKQSDAENVWTAAPRVCTVRPSDGKSDTVGDVDK